MSTEEIRPSVTLAEHLIEQLQRAIVEGHLHLGDKLLESELAMTFGTKCSPIRDALRRFEAQRLVITRPNAGARVVFLSGPPT